VLGSRLRPSSRTVRDGVSGALSRPGRAGSGHRAARGRDLLTRSTVDGVRAVHVTGVLPDGHVSTKRWLQTHAKVSSAHRGALIARGRDLETDYAATRFAWLAGEITSRRGPRAHHRDHPRAAPGARRGPRPDPRRGRGDPAAPGPHGHGRPAAPRHRPAALYVDPDGAAQAQLDAHDDQFLRLTPVGDGVDVKGYLTAETAAALLTCLDQVVDGWYRSGSLGPEDQPTGDDRTDRLRRKHRRDHLNALALADLARRCLDAGRSARSTPSARTSPSPSTSRTWSTASAAPCASPASASSSSHPRRSRGSSATPTSPPSSPAPPTPPAAPTTARPDPRAGRGHPGARAGGPPRRTRPPHRPTTPAPALEVRDQHCAAPGCRIDPSRCEAHHVTSGRTAAAPTSTTWSCSAPATTTPSTKAHADHPRPRAPTRTPRPLAPRTTTATHQPDLEHVVGQVHHGSRGDRHGKWEEEREGRQQQRAEPESGEERQPRGDQRHDADDDVLHETPPITGKPSGPGSPRPARRQHAGPRPALLDRHA
jgi:hypothetical protein